MVQLQENLADLTAVGIQVVGVSPDSVDILKRFSEERKIEFALLSDNGSKTINAFGIHNKRGLPHPGTIVIDKDGVIRAKIFREGYQVRHPVEELIEAAKSL